MGVGWSGVKFLASHPDFTLKRVKKGRVLSAL